MKLTKIIFAIAFGLFLVGTVPVHAATKTVAKVTTPTAKKSATKTAKKKTVATKKTKTKKVAIRKETTTTNPPLFPLPQWAISKTTSPTTN